MPAESSHIRLLSALARRLNRRSNIPALYFFTDPKRTPDPCAIAERLPPGTVIVYRHFGVADRTAQARALQRIAKRHRLKLLIGADAPLAQRIGADGVHLPQRDARQAASLRRAHPNWLITVAVHDGPALARAARFNASAAVLAPVFPSRSASAVKPLGARAAIALSNRARLPVIALGGVTASTGARLIASRFAGVAAIDGLSA